MEKKELMYEGKAKKVWSCEDPDMCIVDYKDAATALNGLKKGTIVGKGIINNKLSNYMMKLITKELGIPTHLIEELSDRETLVKKVKIVPLEVIARNIAAGSLAKRLGMEEGTVMSKPVLEFCYKSDELGDPMVNRYHILAADFCSEKDLDTITDYTFKINAFMQKFFLEHGIILVDFKIEFGKTSDGTVVLADEISPDTCRFWDSKTKEKLDKDRFRRDMGGVEDAYNEVMRRLMGEC